MTGLFEKTSITDQGLTSLTSRCNSLVWIDLRSAQLSAKCLYDTLMQLPNIQCLDNKNLEEALEMYQQKQKKPLKLTVFRTSKKPGDCTLNISTLMPQLKTLELNRKVTVEQINKLHQIEELLTASGGSNNSEALMSIIQKSGSQLKTLDLDYGAFGTVNHVDLIQVAYYCTNLESLQINNYNYSKTTSTFTIKPGTHFRKLKDVTLNGRSLMGGDTLKMSPSVLAAILCAPELNTAYLERIEVKAGLLQALKYSTQHERVFNKLEYVAMVACPLEVDHVMKWICEAPALKKFDTQMCTNLKMLCSIIKKKIKEANFVVDVWGDLSIRFNLPAYE